MSTGIPPERQLHTISALLPPILRMLEEEGFDAPALLRRAGIPEDATADPFSRLPTVDLARFWSLVAEAADDDCVGFRVAEYLQPSTFHALGFLHHVSGTLREAAERWVRFSTVISTAAELRLERHAGYTHACLDLHVDGGALSLHGIDAALAFVHQEARKLVPARLPVFQRLEMIREPPRDPEAHARRFGCEVVYGAPRIRVVVADEVLDLPLGTSNAELIALNEQILTEYVGRVRRDDIVSQVIARIGRSLASGDFSKEAIAADLGMSASTLQRKLRERDTSYQALLDGTRRQLALKMLEDERLPVTRIGYQLGFSDAASFTRRFRSWTGQAPSEYREDRAAG